MIKSKFIKCDSCKKLYTQTIYKNKKSITVCPYCEHKNQIKNEKEIKKTSEQG